MSFIEPVLAQCCHYIDPNLLIYTENQWAGSYILATDWDDMEVLFFLKIC